MDKKKDIIENYFTKDVIEQHMSALYGEESVIYWRNVLYKTLCFYQYLLFYNYSPERAYKEIERLFGNVTGSISVTNMEKMKGEENL